jgi:hypothetical protein
MAELAVVYAGPRLAENGGADVEYRRVRSATPDVDEPVDGSNAQIGPRR